MLVKGLSSDIRMLTISARGVFTYSFW